MKATFKKNQTLYMARRIIGTDILTGARVEVIASYEQRGQEPRYLVRSAPDIQAYVYESDLSLTNDVEGVR